MFLKKEAGVILLLILFGVQTVSATHYILGYVNDSYSGTLANGKSAVMWNPSNGVLDNQTDTISVNTYTFDCESLSTPCSEGDNLSIQVFSGTDTISRIYNVTVTSNNEDYVDTFRINSEPTATINLPENNSFIKNPAQLSCSFSDLDSDTLYSELFANFSGTLSVVNSTTATFGTLIYSSTESEGIYSQKCCVDDGLSNTCTEEYLFTIDSTSPTLNYFEINQTNFCSDSDLLLNCSFSDDNLKEVYFQIQSPSTFFNISDSSEPFILEFEVNETGDYSARCVGSDEAGNLAYSEYKNFTKLDGNPDLSVIQILFSESSPSEGKSINASVQINNSGCASSGTFSIGFYEDSISSENLLDTLSGSLNAFSSDTFVFNFTTLIGETDYFFKADYNNQITESSEDNNEGSDTLTVSSWQNFCGEIQTVRVLGDSNLELITEWGNDSQYDGNIFIADKDSEINWFSLQAIGRTTSGTTSSGDLLEIDSVLGTTTYPDSVAETYSSPSYLSYSFNNQSISNVPSISSNEAESFYTGILWDTSDDSNNEYDSTEKEDIVFISEVQKDTTCTTGTCDYEIKIPAKLREYTSDADTQSIYLYYNLA